MLIASVVLYLLVTITIGLWAASRVHNSKDYVVAGRSLEHYVRDGPEAAEATMPPQLVGLGFSLVGMVLGSLVPRPATEAATHHHGGH
ncbi:MAG TPA: hypothetical protein VHI32_01785 [Burkholderiales bacterium]|nr:hypothetical protein [Burkholderiales bacterium]